MIHQCKPQLPDGAISPFKQWSSTSPPQFYRLYSYLFLLSGLACWQADSPVGVLGAGRQVKIKNKINRSLSSLSHGHHFSCFPSSFLTLLTSPSPHKHNKCIYRYMHIQVMCTGLYAIILCLLYHNASISCTRMTHLHAHD